MDVEGVLAPNILSELADGFEKRLALDVAHRPPDLHQHDVHVLADDPNAVLDFVGDVRDDLNRPAEVVTTPLLLNDGEVDLAGRPIVMFRRDRVGEPFVVTQI